MRGLQDRVAIITGGGGGIGGATARRLGEEGARVAVLDLNPTTAGITAAAIKSAGGTAQAFTCDITDHASVASTIGAVEQALGPVDILVNNAGTTKIVDHADLEGLSADDFLNIYRTNTVGAFQMIRACAPAMKAQGFGAVVNVSSIAGVAGIGSSVAYAASKGAMNTMTISLARALAPEIRVNAVCPGFVGTRWFKDALGQDVFDRMVEGQARTTPLKRAGMPEDVADSIVFFCAEGAQHITGEFLITDAGLHLGMTPLIPR